MGEQLSSAPKWMGTAFLIIGAVVLLSGVLEWWGTRKFVEHALRAEGVVKELSHGPAHPEIEFKLPSGEVVAFPANGLISYRKGQSAKVLYLAEDPGRARLDDFGNLWAGLVFELGLGLVFLCLGAFIRLRG